MLYKQKINYFSPWPKSKSDRLLEILANYFAGKSGSKSSNISISSQSDLNDLIVTDLDYSTDPRSLIEIRSQRQLTALFSKNADVDFGIDKEQIAWEKFCASELNCRSTNKRLSENHSRESFTGAEGILYTARRKINDILGDVPVLNDLDLRFGPGCSSTVKNKTSARFKLEAVPVCSKELHPHLSDVFASLPHYASAHNGRCQVGQGELSFVPKDYRSHRSIMIEPLLNTLCQKGIGTFLKSRYKFFGIDLTDQSINRNRARLSSRDGSLATVDMSSASDNIAYMVVVDLLPIKWVEFLSTFRTGRVYYTKKRLSFELEKFSSMGNGFTFELQSLIFYALAHASCVSLNIHPDISVFGDDVLLPTDAYPTFCAILKECGFSVNTEKSYSTGPFRESCGGDYYDGTNIRPFYVKGRFTDARLTGLINFYYQDPLFDDIRESLFTFYSSPPLYGPPGFGDGHVHVDDYKGTPYKRKHGLSGFTFVSYVTRPKKDCRSLLIGDSLIPLYLLRYEPEELSNTEFTRTYKRYNLHNFCEDLDHYKDVSSRAADPFVIRGSQYAKTTRIIYFN